MKPANIIKIGYTAGIYGCSGEYFKVVTLDGSPIDGTFFHGMYGAEDRVAHALEQKGYTTKYTASMYGRLTRKDIPTLWKRTEGQIIKEIEALN